MLACGHVPSALSTLKKFKFVIPGRIYYIYKKQEWHHTFCCTKIMVKWMNSC